jgi:hypothetical protein
VASGCASRAARRRHATHRAQAAAVHTPASTIDARTKLRQASFQLIRPELVDLTNARADGVANRLLALSLAPQPGLDQLERLSSKRCTAGLDVQLAPRRITQPAQSATRALHWKCASMTTAAVRRAPATARGMG